ncbi:MAG: winged helix-turn-helix domain-containing protein [Comamonas sp.]|nr:winged helix-turn-helix domain-containing protein [Comamonas sp.]
MYADIYLRFLHLAANNRNLPMLPALDPLEERLLEQIANAGTRQERLCVRDLMAQRELGSPATIHTRLKSMRQKGWILLADTEDARRKQIELSADAHKHFEKLSHCIVQAAAES